MAHKKRKEAHPQQGGNITDHHDRLCALECAVAEQARHIQQLTTQGAIIMGSIQDLKDAIEATKADIVAEKAEVQTALTDLRAQIQALKDQIAAGTAVTQADLDALIQSVKDIDTGVKDISEAPPAV